MILARPHNRFDGFATLVAEFAPGGSIRNGPLPDGQAKAGCQHPKRCALCVTPIRSISGGRNQTGEEVYDIQRIR